MSNKTLVFAKEMWYNVTNCTKLNFTKSKSKKETVMKIAVRYYSQSGRTEKVAKAIAMGAGAEALSVTSETVLPEKTDLLFLGGAPYANIMAPELKAYAEKLSTETVDTVVLFTTSNWSKRTVLALRKMLKAKGIKVADDAFYAQAAKVDSRLAAAEAFGKEMVSR